MPESWLIHTLVFDLDDTLYPEADYVRSGFAVVGKWLEAQKGVAGFGERAEALFKAGRRGHVFDEALVSLGMAADADLLAALVQVYREHHPQLTLPDETRDALDWAAGYFSLAIITDGYAGVQRLKLAALGLSRWIDCMVVTDEIGRDRWKPHPAGYEKVMARFPGAATGYVYVADNPKKDFLAPKALGWRTVRLKRAGQEHALVEPTSEQASDVTIAGFNELRQLLRQAV